jgi:uncharacterized protein
VTTLVTADGLRLEAEWSGDDDDPAGAVVLCHPDPRRSGTMRAPLLRSVTGRLVDAGLRVLRFNFRGVGGSEGGWGGGEGELLDVAAAVDHARDVHAGVPVHLAGWSFGAVMALHWQARAGDTSRYAGVAPPVAHDDLVVLPDPAALSPAPRLFVIGDRDRFCTVDDLRNYVGSVEGRLEVIPGADHFFVFRDMEVGRLLARFFLDGEG